MKQLLGIVVHVMILTLSSQSIAAQKMDGIRFKEVETDKPCREARGYICGAELYPDFSSSNLPRSFGIKQVPSLVIPAKEITGAKIIKQQMGKWENWQVEIRFSKEYGKRMKKFTAEKKRQLLAMEISGKIAAIAALASDLEDEITITSTKDKIEELGSLLRTIYPQVTWEIQTQAPKSNRPVDRSR